MKTRPFSFAGATGGGPGAVSKQGKPRPAGATDDEAAPEDATPDDDAAPDDAAPEDDDAAPEDDVAPRRCGRGGSRPAP